LFRDQHPVSAASRLDRPIELVEQDVLSAGFVLNIPGRPKLCKCPVRVFVVYEYKCCSVANHLSIRSRVETQITCLRAAADVPT
jgi:hypothetical protein